MAHPVLDIPDAVRRTALALGGESLRSLEGLDDLVEEIAHDWRLTLGASLHGGSGGYVAEAVTAAGRPVVLKLHMVGHEPIVHEIRTLQIAAGRGYVELLRHDPERSASLMERLGPSLASLDLPVSAQIETICQTLRAAWTVIPGEGGFQTGAEKARLLATMIAEMWEGLNRPCAAAVIDLALGFCEARAAAFDPERSVLVHGDAHAANTLRSLAPGGGFKLVDPDGLFAEPACDLAVPMRDWSEDLMAGDPLEIARRRCALLSRLTGVDPEAIWAWGFMERVSTGLYCIKLGRPELGFDILRPAEAMAAADRPD